MEQNLEENNPDKSMRDIFGLPNNEEKFYKCIHCKHASSTAGSLLLHMKIHSIKKCDDASSHAGNLKTHCEEKSRNAISVIMCPPQLDILEHI